MMDAIEYCDAPRRDAPRRDTPRRDTISIEGTTYDITDFAHPGGSIIGYAKNSGDATDIFREFHYRSSTARNVLRLLPEYDANNVAYADADADADADTEVVDASPVPTLTRRQQEMTSDYREMRTNLINQGCFEPDYIHVYFRMLELAFYFGMGTWLASYNIYASLLSFIIFKTRCGWVQHECGHVSFTANKRIDRAIQTFTMGFGAGVSSSVWNSMHHRHHATPQKIKHDVDLDTTPFVAFFNTAFEENTNGKTAARFMNRWWMRFQAWTFLPIVNGLFVHLFWIYYLHPKKVFHRLCSARTKDQHISATFEIGCMTASHLVLPYIFYEDAGAGGRGIIGAYFLLMIVNFWNFVYLFGHFSLSHTFTGVVPENQHLLWFEYALRHTVNISTKSALVSWVMGYLNFQIEHHLFPSMPQYKNTIAAPYVRRFCEKWAADAATGTHEHLKYTEHSYMNAWRLMLSNLNQVGKHYHNSIAAQLAPTTKAKDD